MNAIALIVFSAKPHYSPREGYANDSAQCSSATATLQSGFRMITRSKVLPSLDLAIVDEALRRTDDNDDAAITRWLIEMFQRAIVIQSHLNRDSESCDLTMN
jgi:hypothetical protein